MSKALTADLLPSAAATVIQVEQLPVATLKEMFHTMLLIRRMEESLLEMAENGKIGGAMHTAIGHEANAIGAAYATMGDYVTCTYRGHHHGIARGMDVKRAMAEVLGRADGFSGGKGGSMHFYAPELGMMGANGIVGAQAPQAGGLALASKLRKEGKIAITFFGEGAIFQGVMHETLNIASKWKLPMIFYCENNHYSEMTPSSRASSIEEVYTLAHAYGMESMQIDGNDVELVYTAVKQAADRARSGEGPTFIEGLTYRLTGHMAGDLETYRTSEEIDLQRKYEPLVVLRHTLLDRGASEDGLGQIAKAVEAEIAEAVEFAESSPWPDVSEAYTHVYQ